MHRKPVRTGISLLYNTVSSASHQNRRIDERIKPHGVSAWHVIAIVFYSMHIFVRSWYFFLFFIFVFFILHGLYSRFHTGNILNWKTKTVKCLRARVPGSLGYVRTFWCRFAVQIVSRAINLQFLFTICNCSFGWSWAWSVLCTNFDLNLWAQFNFYANTKLRWDHLMRKYVNLKSE